MLLVGGVVANDRINKPEKQADTETQTGYHQLKQS